MSKQKMQDISNNNFTVKEFILFLKNLNLSYFSHHPKLMKKIKPKIFGDLTVYIVATSAKHRVKIKSYNEDGSVLIREYILGEAFSAFKIDVIPEDIQNTRVLGIESLSFKDDLYTANNGQTYNNGNDIDLVIVI